MKILSSLAAASLATSPVIAQSVSNDKSATADTGNVLSTHEDVTKSVNKIQSNPNMPSNSTTTIKIIPSTPELAPFGGEIGQIWDCAVKAVSSAAKEDSAAQKAWDKNAVGYIRTSIGDNTAEVTGFSFDFKKGRVSIASGIGHTNGSIAGHVITYKFGGAAEYIKSKTETEKHPDLAEVNHVQDKAVETGNNFAACTRALNFKR